jgi:hypothetical protein
MNYNVTPSLENPSRAVGRSGRNSSAFLKSAIAPGLSPSLAMAWARLFQEKTSVGS